MICDGRTHEEVRAQHLAQIEEHGWSHQMVEGDITGPPFAYTLGLTRQEGHPEVVVSGLPPDVACGVLHAVVEHVQAGHRLTAGTEVDLGHAVVWRVVRVRHPQRLVVAQEIYATPGHAGLVPALQVVWPDDVGRWPWEVPWREARRVQEVFGTPRWRTWRRRPLGTACVASGHDAAGGPA
ncbi:DUF4262 domain-containing protein [uncultured Pseudokineococcus sp.]|uniref:DUF4262 domain-containing protein n=1 Tax=uncultured Pseudokineococcus sp. TaxID=1642928 RepID=UPI0026298813|nr:DUF4262 domain-containing protein [uncultured Pseudokineococcus sp.]